MTYEIVYDCEGSFNIHECFNGTEEELFAYINQMVRMYKINNIGIMVEGRYIHKYSKIA